MSEMHAGRTLPWVVSTGTWNFFPDSFGCLTSCENVRPSDGRDRVQQTKQTTAVWD